MEYYKKSGALRYHFRNGKVSDLVSNSGNPAPLDESLLPYLGINSRNRLTFQIWEKESDVDYMYENLNLAFPLEKILSRYRKYCEAEIGQWVRDVRIKDVLSGRFAEKFLEGEDPETPLVNVCTRVNGDDDLIRLYFPFETGHEERLQKFRRKLIDDMYSWGYNISQEVKVSDKNTIRPANGRNLDVRIGVFEKVKPGSAPVDLPDVLYHVSPGRYLEKIRRNGLVPRSKSSRYSYPERIYFFGKYERDIMLDYGREKVMDLRKGEKQIDGDEGFCIFLIGRRTLEGWNMYKEGKVVFYMDPMFRKKDADRSGMGLFALEPIPPRIINDEFIFVEVGDDGEIGKISRKKFR